MKNRHHDVRRGFTLVELLVVIGILVLLISLLLPLVTRSYRQAGRIRAQADLQTIATGILAYKDDFGDIPRPDQSDPQQKNNGAAILGKALLGHYGDGMMPDGTTTDNADPPAYVATAEYHPGDVFRQSAGSPIIYVQLVDAPAGSGYADYSIVSHFNPLDGADGPGFRTRAGGAGRVSPAYLQPGKISFRGTYLLDHYGNPVIYFPATLKKRNLSETTWTAKHLPYVDQTDYASPEPRPLFIADDNIEIFARRAGGPRVPAEAAPAGDPIVLTRIRIMLGDYNSNGYIDGGETAVTQPYLLWTAGPDGVLGPLGLPIPNTAPSASEIEEFKKAVPKCDDILNLP